MGGPDETARLKSGPSGKVVDVLATVPDRLEELVLRLPARSSSIVLARRAAVQFAEEVGATGRDLWRVRLAVSEAITNVVVHAYDGVDQPGDVLLLATTDRTGITLTVCDHGTGMAPRADSPGMGLGLALIAHSCDEMEVGRTPRGGTRVQMFFSLVA